MSIIYLLITVSVIVAVIFFIAFVYSVRRGQYDDTYTPSVRMLFDDELVKPAKKNPEIQSENNKIQ
ncbi:cbb3-type cytochrome oxidase assembly protein CcoS [Nonlabens antarcticus]|uniref:cbb3-type cytochrome oxidase assembly protein CcoS n=1 Tax=Nonlabens antarcticus TaxID=392714 RepID=UPI0018913964|nr:cbb3-type cytochrome oxidase assembly protein CcoS [Nonlabens antarcticus]